MCAIGEVDVGATRFAPHQVVAVSAPDKGVAGGVVVTDIALGFDDNSGGSGFVGWSADQGFAEELAGQFEGWLGIEGGRQLLFD